MTGAAGAQVGENGCGRNGEQDGADHLGRSAGPAQLPE